MSQPEKKETIFIQTVSKFGVLCVVGRRKLDLFFALFLFEFCLCKTETWACKVQKIGHTITSVFPSLHFLIDFWDNFYQTSSFWSMLSNFAEVV